jgi:hypothetical protein
MEKIIQDWDLVNKLLKEIEDKSDDELNFEEEA